MTTAAGERAIIGVSAGARGAPAERGHAVDIVGVSEGHSTNSWRQHLRDVLVRLFGGLQFPGFGFKVARLDWDS